MKKTTCILLFLALLGSQWALAQVKVYHEISFGAGTHMIKNHNHTEEIQTLFPFWNASTQKHENWEVRQITQLKSKHHTNLVGTFDWRVRSNHTKWNRKIGMGINFYELKSTANYAQTNEKIKLSTNNIDIWGDCGVGNQPWDTQKSASTKIEMSIPLQFSYTHHNWEFSLGPRLLLPIILKSKEQIFYQQEVLEDYSCTSDEVEYGKVSFTGELSVTKWFTANNGLEIAASQYFSPVYDYFNNESRPTLFSARWKKRF